MNFSYRNKLSRNLNGPSGPLPQLKKGAQPNLYKATHASSQVIPMIDENITPISLDNNTTLDNSSYTLYDINDLNRFVPKFEMIEKVKEPVSIDETELHPILRLKKRGITTLCHIYQKEYMDNCKPTGFGDFIRGCFFIFEFCRKHQFEFKIIINHPIAYFLESFGNEMKLSIDQVLSSNVAMYTDCNWNRTIFDQNQFIVQHTLDQSMEERFNEFLANCFTIHHYVFCYSIFFPYSNILPQDKIYMKKLLQPNENMKKYILDAYCKLDLVDKPYIVIHIRSGDHFIGKKQSNESNMNDTYIFKIIQYVVQILSQHSAANILLLSDNLIIKHILCNKFPQMKTLFLFTAHLGTDTKKELDGIRDTLLDFYLMSRSLMIYSATVYKHGSGFSYWCAKIFDIPYKCKFI